MNNLLEKAKLILRIKSDTFNCEILALIKSAQLDMVNSGIIKTKVEDLTDDLIETTILFYVKANFGLSNPETDKYMELYRNSINKLSFISSYTISEETEGDANVD